MSKAQTPSARELTALQRLVQECLELGGDRTAWKQHMLGGLSQLLHSDVGMAVEFAFAPTMHLVDCATAGWTMKQARACAAAYPCPAGNPMLPALQRSRGVGVSCRRQLVPDADWYRCAFFTEHVQPGGMDEGAAFVAFRADGLRVIAAQRAANARFFVDRQFRLLQWFGDRIAPDWGFRLAGPDGPSLLDLSARQRQVLQCLLDGESEKQAALRLGLSAHTVHVHAQRLYRYFRTASRSELFARTRALTAPAGAADAQLLARLTPRQRQVLESFWEGDSEKQTALRLGVSRHTVHFHVQQLYRRFGVTSRGQLLARVPSRRLDA